MELQDKLLPLLREHAIALGIGMAGLIFVGYGLMTLSRPQSSNTVAPPPAGTAVRNAVSPLAKEITIDIEGAVEKPGVYKLPAQSRIQDALIAAGGLSQNADRQKIAQTVNLAAPLTDSAKLYLPAVGEHYAGSGIASGTSTDTGQGASGIVNINQASEAELDALPGVGAVTAQRIIDGRPYQGTQDLVTKKIVGQSEFEKIKDQISVY